MNHFTAGCGCSKANSWTSHGSGRLHSSAINHAEFPSHRRRGRDQRCDPSVDPAASKLERPRLSRDRESTLDRRRARFLTRRSSLNRRDIQCQRAAALMPACASSRVKGPPAGRRCRGNHGLEMLHAALCRSLSSSRVCIRQTPGTSRRYTSALRVRRPFLSNEDRLRRTNGQSTRRSNGRTNQEVKATFPLQ